MEDRARMAEALRLAHRGPIRVSPNPRVGAVVVRGRRVVGTGWHRGPGTAHAEAAALERAGAAARGGTLYVTLEPCDHRGRTGPCTDAILASGVRRVVCAMLDPDARVRGRGVRRLRRGGVRVEVGLSREEAEAMNESYLHHRRTGRPFVTLKLAMTLDARIADRRGGSRWVSGASARRLVHRWRAASDAVMVGRGTVAADDPALTVRLVRGTDPARVVLDSGLRLDAGRRVFRAGARRVVAAAAAAPRTRERRLAARGVEVWRFRPGRRGRGADGVPLAAFLRRAGSEGMTSLLVEGGAELGSALLREGLVDRIAFFIAPKLAGGEGRAALDALGVEAMPGALRLERTEWRRVGEDLLVTARPAAPRRGRR